MYQVHHAREHEQVQLVVRRQLAKAITRVHVLRPLDLVEQRPQTAVAEFPVRGEQQLQPAIITTPIRTLTEAVVTEPLAMLEAVAGRYIVHLRAVALRLHPPATELLREEILDIVLRLPVHQEVTVHPLPHRGVIVRLPLHNGVIVRLPHHLEVIAPHRQVEECDLRAVVAVVVAPDK
jgi:hypothetical protein